MARTLAYRANLELIGNTIDRLIALALTPWSCAFASSGSDGRMSILFLLVRRCRTTEHCNFCEQDRIEERDILRNSFKAGGHCQSKTRHTALKHTRSAPLALSVRYSSDGGDATSHCCSCIPLVWQQGNLSPILASVEPYTRSETRCYQPLI